MARAKKPEQFGKGKVTPVQVAYIVDQYLSENLFTQTRSSFRSEALTLISKTPLQEGPKGLMSLHTIIDEYVSLKEQKMVVEMEKRRTKQERFRVQTMLQGMQNVMNAYDASAPAAAACNVPALAPAAASVSEKSIHAVPQSDLSNASPAAGLLGGQIVKVSPHTTPPWVAPNISRGPLTSFTTQMVVNPPSKRRHASSMAPTNAKKSRTKMPNKQLSDGNSQQSVQQPATLPSSTSSCVANMSPVQGSSVATVMFHQTTSTSGTQNSSDPVTPPRAPSAHTDKRISPVGHSSSTDSCSKSTPPDFASNCTIVSTKTVIVSPYKQAAYYSVEKHCSSTCSPAKGNLQRSIKRDRVKGRLNFDGADDATSLEKSTANESSISESDDTNIFDLDLPILDFNISDLLLDFNIHCGELV